MLSFGDFWMEEWLVDFTVAGHLKQRE